MGFNSRLKGDLMRRAKCLPIPETLSSQFITLVIRWVQNSGEEWTIDRLKAIKLDLIRIRSGNLPVSEWICRGRHQFFGGTVGRLEKLALQYNCSRFSQVIQLLQVYTSFKAKGVTPSQWKKFTGGVFADPPSISALNRAKAVLDIGFKFSNLRRVKVMPKRRPLLDMVPSMSRRAPTLEGSVPEEQGILDSLYYIWKSWDGRAHFDRYEHLYEDVLTGLKWADRALRGDNRMSYTMNSKRFYVGRIGLIQEPGYKLRAVANPGRVFQRVLEPLGSVLYGTLPKLPWDCTFDQSKSFPFLKEALRNGNVVHSVDLSGATDYFPLALQEHVLSKVFPKEEVDLFSEISKGYWVVPKSKQGLQWRRGQPLGLYPSFGAFALTHGLLLLGLAGGNYYHQFFVLGDDVVILDSDLASRYQKLLSDLECPISETKSISSPELCEFGGKIVTSTDVIPQFKWRAISDDSFIDLVRNLGPRSYPLLRNRQRKIIDRLSPIPECFGGLGWNPKGIPLKTRISNEDWIWDDPKPRNLTTSFSPVNIRLIYQSKLYRHSVNLSRKGRPLDLRLTESLDQRAQALTKNHLGSILLPWWRILGKNLDQVLRDAALIPDLPIQMVESHRSTLVMYERKLEIRNHK